MQNQQNWRNYPLPVLVFDAVGDQYEDYNELIPQVKKLLTQPGLAGGVHVIQPAETS